MAYARLAYLNVNGSTNQFDVTFPYISKTHVIVKVDGTATTNFTWLTSSRIQLTATPASGSNVIITRETSPTTRLVDYQTGSILSESILDTDSLQAFYLGQEAQDVKDVSFTKSDADNQWDAETNKIKNLTDPTAAQDAATKNYVDTAGDSKVAQAAASATSAAASAVTAGQNAGTQYVDTFDGTGSQTAFTLSASPTTENNTLVTISGVVQHKSAYSLSGSTLTFSSAPAAGTGNIEVVHLSLLPTTERDLSSALANGNTTGGYDIAVGANDDITLTDASTIKFGTGGDGLSIYHNGLHSYISESGTGTGNLYVLATDINFGNQGSSKTYATFTGGDGDESKVRLYYNSSTRIETTSAGARIYGDLQVDDDITLDDGKNIKLGTGGDGLGIYHNGLNSYITEIGSGTGNLFVLASDLTLGNKGNSQHYAHFASGGASKLFYNNGLAFETTSVGGKITGALEVTGDINLGHASDTTISRASAGVVTIEGQTVRTGTVAIADGGTGSTSAGAARTALGVDAAGTDNSTPVTLAGTPDYITISGQEITRNAIDLTTDVSGALPITNGGTGATTAAAAANALGVGTSSSPTFSGVTATGTLHLDSDGASINFGDDAEVSLSHVHNAGLSLNSNLYIADNKSINIGGGNDLSLWHDTNDSHIVDQGSGNLFVKTNGTAIKLETYGGDDLATFTKDGSVELFYDDSKKLETTSSGVHITSTAPTIRLEDTQNNYSGYINGDNGNVLIQSYNANRDIIFGENAASGEKARLTGLGKFGLGTSAPTAPLDVRGYVSNVGVIYGNAGAASQYLMTLTDGVATNFSVVTNGSVLTLGSDAGSTQTAIKASGVEAIRIDSSQRVGIGTSTPDSNHKLEVYGTGTTETSIRSGNSAEAIINFGDVDSRLRGRIAYNNTNEYMAFWANGGEKARLLSSGNFGVGTDSANQVLHANSSGSANLNLTSGSGYLAGILFGTAANPNHGRMQYNPGTGAMTWCTNDSATAKMTLNGDGLTGIGTTSPDTALTISKLSTKPTGGSNAYGVRLYPTSTGGCYLDAITGSTNTAHLKLRTYNGSGGAYYHEWTFSDAGTFSTAGSVTVNGTLSKNSGSFKIDHPLPAKKDTHHLVHSFTESPQADLIYRGRATLVDGEVSVDIDDAAGMTSGTFEVLCRDIQCFTSNETGWTAVRGSVSGATLTIEAQDNSCTDTISWMVVGERQDPHMFDTDWTDDNGKVIVEPLKPTEEDE